MSGITREAIDTSSDEDLFSLLAHELETRIISERGAPEFVAEIKGLPVGLRAMAATYELEVSLALDDIGWHFGNWHNIELSEETAKALLELGAPELAEVYQAAFRLAQDHWTELGSEGWSEWYYGSPLEKALAPLTKRAWSILEGRKNGIFNYWVDYARRFPERIGNEMRPRVRTVVHQQLSDGGRWRTDFRLSLRRLACLRGQRLVRFGPRPHQVLHPLAIQPVAPPPDRTTLFRLINATDKRPGRSPVAKIAVRVRGPTDQLEATFTNYLLFHRD